MTDYRNIAESLLIQARNMNWQSEDYYWKKQEIYPMAIGNFLRAACALSRKIPDDATYKSLAKELLELALSRSNLLNEFKHTNWGLPFPWPTLEEQKKSGGQIILSGDFFWDEKNPLFTRNFPAHLGCGVTTALVGEGIIDSYELFRQESLKDIVEDIGRWFEEECGYRMIDGNVFFNYSPAMKHLVYNGSVLAAAFMARAGDLSGNEDWIELSRSAMKLMADIQDERGGWVYAAEKQDIEYHYGYSLESIALYYQVTKDPIAREMMLRGADFYWDELFDPDGKAYDMVGKKTETRLWAYGWGISAFILVAQTTGERKYIQYAEIIAEYMMKHLWMPEAGMFKFKKNNADIYMRDEAHAAFGFALLASL